MIWGNLGQISPKQREWFKCRIAWLWWILCTVQNLKCSKAGVLLCSLFHSPFYMFSFSLFLSSHFHPLCTFLSPVFTHYYLVSCEKSLFLENAVRACSTQRLFGIESHCLGGMLQYRNMSTLLKWPERGRGSLTLKDATGDLVEVILVCLQ